MLRLVSSALVVIIVALSSLWLHNAGKGWWYPPVVAAISAIGFLLSLFLGDSQSVYRRAAKRLVGVVFASRSRATIALVVLSLGTVSLLVQVVRTWPGRYLAVQVYRTSAIRGNFAVGARVIVHMLADGSTREDRVDSTGFARFTGVAVPTPISIQLNETRQGIEWAWGPGAVDVRQLPHTLSYDLSRAPGDAWMQITRPSISRARDLIAAVPASDRSSTGLREVGDRSLQRTNAPWGVPQAELVVNRYAYILGIDPAHRIPRWVAYSHAPSDREAGPRPQMRLDPAIPVDMQPDNRDFRRSGYDRGHLVSPSDVRFKGPLAVVEANYLSTLTPQTPELNRGVWLSLENATRELAHSVGQVYVLAGPLFLGGGTEQTIGENAIPVPTHFFRVICWISLEGKLQSAAYVAPNHVERDADIRDFVVSIGRVEVACGLELLPDLDPSEAQSIKEASQQLPGL